MSLGTGKEAREFKGAALKGIVRKALHRERMFENLERRSKEPAIVAALAEMIAGKTISADTFRDRETLEGAAALIKHIVALPI